MKLDGTTANFLGVLAANRRLAQLPAIIRAFRALAAQHRGEPTAAVASAHPLSGAPVDARKAELRQRLGRDVAVALPVDPALLGGLKVSLGRRAEERPVGTEWVRT